ncbi:hypothetical protein [Virgibacillus oceani]|uniref:DUF4025 domain-containing protein n=1 Tax=Virgibacillus oceani TaxID=1479511 RepID=A0A917HNU0_9BACI|nr:hypothetical protein [Virgibacillus oceani]GGG84364.1 hypothetical protein GCM10011398_32510 [Virgibacillus oceani]
MTKKKRNERIADSIVAPGIDPEASYGDDATQSDIEKGDTTTVTRLIYDEYDPSEKNDT